jgi:hypothetical protein
MTQRPAQGMSTAMANAGSMKFNKCRNKSQTVMGQNNVEGAEIGHMRSQIVP